MVQDDVCRICFSKGEGMRSLVIDLREISNIGWAEAGRMLEWGIRGGGGKGMPPCLRKYCFCRVKEIVSGPSVVWILLKFTTNCQEYRGGERILRRTPQNMGLKYWLSKPMVVVQLAKGGSLTRKRNKPRHPRFHRQGCVS